MVMKISPLRDMLYCGVYGGTSGAVAAIAKVQWRENDKHEVYHLQNRMAAFKKAIGKHVLLHGEISGEQSDLCQLATPPSSGNESTTTSHTSTPPGTGDGHDTMEADLKGLIQDTGRLLGPLLTTPVITDALTTISLAPKAAIVLLLDEEFISLPVEAVLPIISQAPNIGVSRDFSLHMLHHRLTSAREISGKQSGARTACMVRF